MNIQRTNNSVSANSTRNTSRGFTRQNFSGKKNLGGFTLIELIVVIAIIGVLSGVILVALSSARAKTRDATRKAQLIELNTAINHYFSQNGTYPDTGEVWFSSEIGDSFVDNSGNWIPGLVAANMIGSLPRDPLGGKNPVDCSVSTNSRAYLYKSDGAHYKLLKLCP